ncbi:MAG: shikimate dehydrogenase [Neisseriaceae bacterium]|nr:shikimate dehydrogenase [Neisseriaceae bacterium]
MTAPLFAVFGNPIAHSRSPEIHQLFAKQQGIDLIYEKRLVSGSLKDAVQQFAKDGGVGANVTVPCKEEAFALCSQLSNRAKAAGAVNTLIRLPENTWGGDNTDGAGLVMDLQRLNALFSGVKVLLIGAGGAARGVILPLQQAGAEVFIHNRTHNKAQNLANQFHATAQTFDELNTQTFDIIINATSASLSGSLPELPSAIFKNAQLAYDMVYAKNATPFMQFAKHSGCLNTADGLGMLVGQAAVSYHLWHGFMPDIQQVLQQMRENF